MHPLVSSIFLYACESWTLRAAKKNTSHGSESLLRDAMHIIQRPCYQWGSLCQDPAGSRTHEDLTIIKRWKLKWQGHVCCLSGLAKTISQGTVKGGRSPSRWERGRKTTSGSGQAWGLPSPRGRWGTEKNGGSQLWSHLWCPSNSWLRDRLNEVVKKMRLELCRSGLCSRYRYGSWIGLWDTWKWVNASFSSLFSIFLFLHAHPHSDIVNRTMKLLLVIQQEKKIFHQSSKKERIFRDCADRYDILLIMNYNYCQFQFHQCQQCGS